MIKLKIKSRAPLQYSYWN